MDVWTNAVWNQVFAGVEGAPAQSFPNPPYTTLDANPASREKPFLYVDSAGRFKVYVPDAQRDSSGTTWAGRRTPGRAIGIDDFFIAHPGDGVKAINHALSRGKNLLSRQASTTSATRSRSSAGTRSCSGSAWRRSRHTTASCR